MTRRPDFANMQAVLANQCPERPTLFEFFMNGNVYEVVVGPQSGEGPMGFQAQLVKAYAAMGYDYATLMSGLMEFGFKHDDRAKAASVSINEGGVIHDEASLAAYQWQDPADGKYERIDEAAKWLPDGMKFIAMGPGGVLENVIGLIGYEDLCFALADQEEWVEQVVDGVGSRLLGYYERLVDHPAIGAVISNDDWGFAQQTMLSPADMRRLIFPWHKKIVACIHAAGKPAILHSCGNFRAVIDDVIDDMGYDARHSYEDNTIPVEEAYDTWGDRIAILGGIDLDFVCRSSPDKIRARAQAMLERSAEKGGYALGTGNSVPDYCPTENFLALISAATEQAPA